MLILKIHCYIIFLESNTKRPLENSQKDRWINEEIGFTL